MLVSPLFGWPGLFIGGVLGAISDGGFDVVDVIAGAPADTAGLKAGDRIVGVNGKKAVRDVSLPDFRLLKKAPAGTNLILDVLRGGQRLRINMTLRDLV